MAALTREKEELAAEVAKLTASLAALEGEKAQEAEQRQGDVAALTREKEELAAEVAKLTASLAALEGREGARGRAAPGRRGCSDEGEGGAGCPGG